MNKINKTLLLLPMILPLCSFTNTPYPSSGGSSSTPQFVDVNNGTHIKNYGTAVGVTEQIDLGRRNAGIIGQYLEYTILSYSKYDALEKRGFVFSYDPVFKNPKAFDGISLTLSVTYAYQYQYAYSKSIGWNISNELNIGVGGVFVEIESSVQATQTTEFSETYTYTFGTNTTRTYSYTFDLSTIPSGYVFTLCLVCSAEEFTIDYCVYNNYWLGPVPSGEGIENQTIDLLRYDASSLFLTLGIKQEGASGGPAKYLTSN